VDEIHTMNYEGGTDADVVFACDECGRRVVVGKHAARLVVIDRGDVFARHTGSTGGLQISGVVPAA